MNRRQLNGSRTREKNRRVGKIKSASCHYRKEPVSLPSSLSLTSFYYQTITMPPSPSPPPPLPDSIQASFLHPHSLHPKIVLTLTLPTFTINPSPSPNQSSCTLHTLLFLNDKLFLDPYELEDLWPRPPQGKGKNGGSASVPVPVLTPTGWILKPEVPDLERPVRYGFRLPPGHEMGPSEESVVESYLQIHHDLDDSVTSTPNGPERKRSHWMIEIPTHARYQQPHQSGYRNVSIGAVSATNNQDVQTTTTIIERQYQLKRDIDVMGVLACSRPLDDGEQCT